MNRKHPRLTGVYQRCDKTCPADRCRSHRWAYLVELPAGPDGKRRQIGKGGYATAKEAADARAEVTHQHRGGNLPTDMKMTLGQWLPQWIDSWVALGKLRDTSEAGYRLFTRAYLIPKLGHIKLAELRSDQITRAYITIMRERQAARAAAEEKNRRYAAEAAVADQRRIARGLVRPVRPKRCAVPPPLGPTTIRRIHATLSGALKAAVKAKLITRNPAADADLPEPIKVKIRPWTPEELGRFLDATEDERLYPLFVLAAFSGLRRGELCGLQWGDIDLDGGRLTVARQRISLSYSIRERDETKSDAGQDRVVWLDRETLAVLRAWRKTQLAERLAWGPAYEVTDWIFTLENGKPVHPEQVTKTFARLVRLHKLPAAKLHSLRHFRAASLMSTGADIAAVSKTMGHSSVQITADIYGSLFDKTNREMSEAAAALVPRRRRPA